jgi:uncharacterized phage infection (PIP) family protein YhgE
MPLPLRDQNQNSSGESKNKLYLPDEIPAIPEDHLKKFPELRSWYESLVEWWTEVKDILIRTEDLNTLTESLTELEEKLSQLGDELDNLPDNSECCSENATAIEELAQSLQTLSEEVASINTAIENDQSFALHVANNEAHGADGDIVGINTLNAVVDSINQEITNVIDTMTTLNAQALSLIAGANQFQDLEDVDDTTPSPLEEDFDDDKGIEYKFIQISPQAGTGAYTLDVELDDDNKDDIVIEFFINGVASTNPTIRLVKEDTTVIHSETLDGSGDDILVRIVRISTDFKVIGRWQKS